MIKKKKIIYRGKYENKLKSKGETNELPDMTIQGQTYTIRELLVKHTNGVMPDNLERQPVWGEDVNFDSLDLQSIKNMDLHDQMEHLEHVRSIVSQAAESVKAAQAAAKEKADGSQPDSENPNKGQNSAPKPASREEGTDSP